MRLAPFAAASAFVLLSASSALATSNFPTALRTKLTLTYDPQCATCHTNGITGKGTVNTPFGTSMRARGLVASDEAKLATAVDQMVTDKVDSDLDGVTDVDELKAGTDPNAKPGASSGVGYGCNASGADPSSLAVGIGVAAALLMSRGRRRRAV